ncbi:hypothetical protein LCGC14_2062560 [marine sediment metagenome]|uniref:Uncharacterized protein n=1 Tax=marine sediment metagenome TaxID=412755 RepID=A0A0F9GZ81_9ZZZZ
MRFCTGIYETGAVSRLFRQTGMFSGCAQRARTRVEMRHFSERGQGLIPCRALPCSSASLTNMINISHLTGSSMIRPKPAVSAKRCKSELRQDVVPGTHQPGKDWRHLIVFGNDGNNCLPENPAVRKSNLKLCWRFRVSLVASRNSTPCAGRRYRHGSAAALRCGSSGECGHEDQFFRAIIMRAAALNSRNVMPCIASPKGWSEPLLEPPAFPTIPKPS